MHPQAFLSRLILSIALATAPVLAGEDRDNSTPTGWGWWYGQTTAQVSNFVSSGFRIVDIKVQTASPLTFTVALVANSGSYSKTSWWYSGVTGPQLSSHANTNNARIVALDAYDDGSGTTKFAASLVSNTGADNKGWWWTYNASIAGISNVANTNGARPILTREYKIGSTTYFAAVLIANTGADAKGWWHWYGATPAFIASQVSSTGGRVYDLTVAGTSGYYNAVIVKESNEPKWWYYYGLTEQTVNDLCGNLGTRVMTVERTGTTFNVVLIDNLNDTERRTNDAMRKASDGWVGAYLKKANGAVLAGFNQNRIFEPASTIKTCIHLYAMRQVMLGNDNLGSNVTVYTGASGSCPQYSSPVTETLQTVLQKMMENSDNNRTLAAADRFGVANVNTQNNSLGFGNIDIKHRIGCGGAAPNVPNTMTLVDIGKLHEQVINGYLGNQRQTFYNLMLQSPDGYGGLASVLTDEASNVGLSAAQLSAFKGAMAMAYKGGSYGYSGLNYYSYGAYVSLPFYTASGIVDQEYVTGVFIDSATNATNIGNALTVGSAEVLRDVIHAAMLTWKGHAAGYFAAYGAGCKGTNGLVPALTGYSATGEPNAGTSIQQRLANGRSNTAVALYLGGSKTAWGAFALPLTMAPFGMPTCSVLCSLTLSLPTTTNASGNATVPIAIPNNAALIGGHVFSQFLVADSGANALSLVLSNGLDTVIGGQK